MKLAELRRRYSAKQRSLKVWKYLADHPEIDMKQKLPKDIGELVWKDTGSCPLCTLFHDHAHYCPDCPLSSENVTCFTTGEPYALWEASKLLRYSYPEKAKEERVITALLVYYQIKEWKWWR